jgi:hypothetical protein
LKEVWRKRKTQPPCCILGEFCAFYSACDCLSVFEAAIYCEYQAWQLIKLNNGEAGSHKSEANTKASLLLKFSIINRLNRRTTAQRKKEKNIFAKQFKELINKNDAPEFLKNSLCTECTFRYCVRKD